MKKKIFAALMAGLIVYFAIDDKARAQATSAVVRVNQLSGLIGPLLPGLLNLCMANGVACLDASGFVIQAELNYTQGAASSVNRTVQNKLQESVSAMDFSGADIGAKINAAKGAWSGVSCGAILVPAGTYVNATQINFDSTSGCRLIGSSGITAGATGGTKIIWTGTGTIVSARSSNGFEESNIQWTTTNPSFTGSWFDGSSIGTDTAFCLLSRNSFFSTAGGLASIGINLDKAIGCQVEKNNFSGYLIAIKGGTDSSSFSNVIDVGYNQFVNQGSAVSAIRNPGNAWDIHNNNFEMGPTAVVTDCTSDSVGAIAVHFTANWIGDAVSGTQTYINTCGGGWQFSADYISGSGTSTAISFPVGVWGIAMQGNELTNHALGFVFNSNNGINIQGNIGTLLTTVSSGSITSGTFENPQTFAKLVNGPTTIGNLIIPTSLTINGPGATIDAGTGNLNFQSGNAYVQSTGAIVSSDSINAMGGFTSNGNVGSTFSLACPGGQHLAGLTVVGGLVTATPTCN